MSDVTAIAEELPSAKSSAIRLHRVTKRYHLYGSPLEQALDVFGISRLLFWRSAPRRYFTALDDVSVVVSEGERVGIVGRNGAGKTTLLKLITKNFAATTGNVEIRGKVQALMQTGLGFHPEFTGLENLRSSLLYNGLYGRDLERALQDVIDFVELGDFLLQPFKTYSLGMRSRLQFAAATAIHPEILIIDEVLGAGDAYFSAKSAVRMKELTSTGCTLILVSHSMQQILQFCDRAIWLESGAIVMDDKALSVVRSYEEFCRRLEHEAEKARVRGSQASILSNDWLRRRIIAEVCDAANSETDGTAAGRLTPSRWPSEGGIRIANILARGSDGQQTWLLQSQMAADFEFVIEAEHNGEFRCRYVFVVFSDDGRLLSRHCSDYECFSACAGERRIVRLHFPTLLLGNGRFVASAAIYKELDLEQVNSAIPYDLLSRSFEFRVVAEYSDDPSMFHHPGEWQMSRAES